MEKAGLPRPAWKRAERGSCCFLCPAGFVPAGTAVTVDVPKLQTRGLSNSDGLRLLIFPQPLGEALKNQNAAPTTPPCFCRRQWSSSLHWADCLRCVAPPPCSNPPACVSLLFVQKKNARVFLHKRSLGGRGWIARAALLKTAHWAVFALSSATAPQLFESTRICEFHAQAKQKAPAY